MFLFHHRRLSKITLLCVLWGISAPSSASESSPADPDARVQERFTAVDAVLELRFDRAVLETAGVELDAAGSSQLGRSTLVYDFLPRSGSFSAVFFNGVLGSLPGGDLSMRGAPVSVRAAYRNPLLIESVRVVHEPLAGGAFEFGIYTDAPGNLRLFDLSGANFDFDNEAETMLIEADLRMSMDLADALGTPELSGRIIGRVHLTMRMRLTETVVTRADGDILSAVLHPIGDGPFASGDFPTEGPDVIVGDLPATNQFGRIGPIGSGTVGLAIGTTSCNKGNVELNWFALSNTDHPVIPFSLYRLHTVDGSDRFEQIGHSWMKHAFTALQFNACGFGCTPANNGTHLGVGCSDPYSSGLNASQCGLGPPAAVNPYTGVFPGGGNMGGGGGCNSNYPARNHMGHAHNGISHRLQVQDVDLTPALNPGATYYSEAQYITPHEFNAANGNQNNNISYRKVNVSGGGGGTFSFSNNGGTVREQPAIDAWPGATQRTIEPDSLIDGRAFLATEVTDLGGGWFHYEYAIYNMHLNRSIRSFSVPLSSIITIENVGFHAPLNHAAEANTPTLSNDPWDVEITSSAITWSTQTFAQNPNANAIRFGTLYNFRFDANGPPQSDIVTIGLFNPAGNFQTGTDVPTGPGDCNNNMIADPCDLDCFALDCNVPGCGGSEDCNNNSIPDECDIASGFSLDCDNNGSPDECEPFCLFNCHCSDGEFCTGQETCVDSNCLPGGDPCPDQLCRESDDRCVDCLEDTDCSDELLCTVDTCVDGACEFPDFECPEGELCNPDNGVCTSSCFNDASCPPGMRCDLAKGICKECLGDADCTDGQVCNPIGECKDCLDDTHCAEPEHCTIFGECGECGNNSHCVDDSECTENVCSGGVCEFIGVICAPPLMCDPDDGLCKECLSAEDCPDGQICDPAEGVCTFGCLSDLDCTDGKHCDLTDGLCKECLNQGHCDDGLFCNGDELCNDSVCQTGAEPCPLQICDEDEGACVPDGDPLRGGQLYDNWMAAIGVQGPAEDHPLWQFRPDQTTNSRTGAATWRCKECHAWDRKGVEGQYATGPHRTGFPGIVGTTLSAFELVALLTEPSTDPRGGNVTNGHSYGTVLSGSDIEDLTAFVQNDGAFDDDAYIDPSSGEFAGDPVQGEINYQFGGSISCGTCHGTDGTAINFNPGGSPEWVGTHAVDNPWEVMHKVRYGNPGTPMPSWIAGGGDLQGIADLGRYIQDTFPIDCLNESHCNGDTMCVTDTCLDGRCTFSDRLYGDLAGDGGSCGPDETVDLFDILAVLNGFQGIFAEGCGVDDLNIAGDGGSCTPNDTIDLIDILAVLNAFAGDDPCCTAAKTQRRSRFSRGQRDPG